MAVFNKDNQNWRTGKYPLFLGEPLGLLDTVNTAYSRLYDLYKLQKSIDWDENEVNLDQSRLDMDSCPKETRDIMLNNLAFQAELDGVAARGMAPLLAPFITNTEFWLGVSKISEVENLHAISYTTIIRNTVKNKEEFFELAVKNEELFDRATTVMSVLDELQIAGARYILDPEFTSRRELQKMLLKAYIAIYCLERLQFMSSFAATFAIGESGLMVGIAKIVAKIAQDEQLHAAFDEEVIKILLSDTEWRSVYEEIKPSAQKIVDEVMSQELDWNKYLFSNGRKIVGLNEKLLGEQVKYNGQTVYAFLGLDNPYEVIKEEPLSWMKQWLDISQFQFAAQEGDLIDYAMNVVNNDISDEEDFDTDF